MPTFLIISLLATAFYSGFHLEVSVSITLLFPLVGYRGDVFSEFLHNRYYFYFTQADD